MNLISHKYFTSALGLCLLLAVPPLCAEQATSSAPAEPADATEIRAEIDAIEKLLPTYPDRGAGLFLLAYDYAHLGNPEKTMALLKECISHHEGFDASGVHAFEPLRDKAEFKALVESVQKEFPRVSRARLAFRIFEKELFPEGIAYDARKDNWFLGSLYRRKIIRLTRGGLVFDFYFPYNEEMLPILGLKIDPTDSGVWAATGDDDSGRSALVHFNASGKILARYAPDEPGKHLFNDLVLRGNDEVIVTDSLANRVYRLNRNSGAFTKLPVHRALLYPNGIALADDGTSLYVADGLGVVRTELASGKSRDVLPGANTTLAGIDGLYWHKGSLIAVQNGIGAPRVVAFQLAPDGLSVQNTTVLERRTEFTELPTTGAIADDKFYFMGNTQIDLLQGNKITSKRKLEDIPIAVVELPE